ncbi:DUF5719 family protein [Arthrobacter sp. Soil763]|uniref:DUF5719 family protein n=1 Tax=Arthrobacter sp. Soil763 TaxID=1736402 RepID=UPI0006FF2DD1|nr:DUF5719 family protein [Arthrobacter sp. Soil763]KRE77360.1 hypothetical protein ASG71_13675 [Arthrobacter sp. Soil763]
MREDHRDDDAGQPGADAPAGQATGPARQPDDTAAQPGSTPAQPDTAPVRGRAGRPGPAPRTPAARRLRSAAAAVGGLAAAAVLVAAGGGLIAADRLAPQGPGSRQLQAPLTAVPAGSSVGICPGPARLLQGTPVGTDPQFSPESATARSAVTAVVLSSGNGTLPGSRLAALGGRTLAELAKPVPPASAPAPSATVAGPAASAPVPTAAVEPQRGVQSATVLSADALANQQPSAAGLLSYTAADGDLRGAAAAACQRPSNDQWLVGANTALGRTAVLHLSNASGTPATVSLDLFGAKGTIQAPGSRGLLVAPGKTRSIILAGLAPGQDRLSVRVRSTGGPVSAIIQQSVLRGLTPGGVDFIAPGAAPAARQVISGIDIQNPAAVRALGGKTGFADATPGLQITVPGAADAVVEVKLFGRDGQKPLPGGGVVTAKAGAVTEIPLAGVPAGHYTVSATSDVSFAAAARITRGLDAGEAADFAWAPSSGRLGSQHVVPMPQKGERFLVFGAPEGRARISYTPITADGKVRAAATADIAGGTTASVRVPDDVGGSPVAGYLVSASGDAAYGAVLLQQEGRADIASVAVTPGAAGSQEVPVSLGY